MLALGNSSKTQPHITPVNGNVTPIDPKISLRNRLAETAIRTMREMAADHQYRMSNFHKNVKLLDKGVFYGTGYYTALKACNQLRRLDWCKQNGSFQHNLAPKEFFDRDRKSNCYKGKLPHGIYDLKKGKQASEALSAIRTGLSIIDCGDACEIAFLEALKETFGSENFNSVFGGSPSLFFGSDIQGAIEKDKLLYTFLKADVKNSEEEIEESFEKIKQGQWIFILGSPSYKMKNFHGYGRGINVICCDDTPGNPKFIGLGLPPEGASLEEIQKFLLNEYNELPLHEDQYLEKSAKETFLEGKTMEELLKRDSLKDDTKSFSEFISDGGGKVARLFIDYNLDNIDRICSFSSNTQ